MTFAFRTREGSVGVLQLTHPAADKQAVSVRYKLLNGPGHLRKADSTDSAVSTSKSKVPKLDEALEELAMVVFKSLKDQDVLLFAQSAAMSRHEAKAVFAKIQAAVPAGEYWPLASTISSDDLEDIPQQD